MVTEFISDLLNHFEPPDAANTAFKIPISKYFKIFLIEQPEATLANVDDNCHAICLHFDFYVLVEQPEAALANLEVAK